MEILLLVLILFLALNFLFLIYGIFLLFGNFFLIFGAPFVPCPKKEIKGILELASPLAGEIFYDLGSGDGRILIEAAKKYNLQGVGIEINPLLFLYSRIKIKKLGLQKKIKIFWGNFFKKNLSNANIIFVYLLQPTNDKLEKKFLSELRPGTKIISKTFTFKKIPLLKSHPKFSSLRLYKIP